MKTRGLVCLAVLVAMCAGPVEAQRRTPQRRPTPRRAPAAKVYPVQEWATDVRAVARAIGTPVALSIAEVDHGNVPFPLSAGDFLLLAREIKTPADMGKALLALPTPARRERARAILEPFTSWGVPHPDGH